MSWQFWEEYENGRISFSRKKYWENLFQREHYIPVAYKGIKMKINIDDDVEAKYQEIIKNQNKNQMKTSKIKSIQNDGTWNDLFKFEVEMENGDVGGCFAKTQIPSWKVGDEMNYEYTQKGKYWNIKFLPSNKPAWNSGGAAKSFGKSPEDKADIARAVALKAAVDLHKGEGEPMEKQIGIICATAQAFEIYLTSGENPYKDAIADGKMNNADDLPF